MKKLIAILLVALFALNLSSCGMLESANDASFYSINFILSLKDGGDATRSFLHTDSWPGEERLEDFITQLERASKIDFSNGVEIIDSKWNMSALYDGTYNGRANRHTYELLVGGKNVHMFVVVVDNDVDYGVMYFGIYDPELEQN